MKLEEGTKIDFSYEVSWKESDLEYARRYEKYLDPTFFQHRIHWYGFNLTSFVLLVRGREDTSDNVVNINYQVLNFQLIYDGSVSRRTCDDDHDADSS